MRGWGGTVRGSRELLKTRGIPGVARMRLEEATNAVGVRHNHIPVALLARLKGFLNRFNNPGVLASISRQLRDGHLEFFASHDRQDALDRFQLQELLATDKEIVFRDQANKIEIE